MRPNRASLDAYLTQLLACLSLRLPSSSLQIARWDQSPERTARATGAVHPLLQRPGTYDGLPTEWAATAPQSIVSRRGRRRIVVTHLSTLDYYLRN